MLVLSNQCGNAIQNGRDIAANNIPSPIETMIKSISQAINLSIQLASTIASVSVFVAADDDDGKVVSVVGLILLLSNISTITPAIRTIIPAIVRMTPAIIPLNELKLTYFFAPINGRLPANTILFSSSFGFSKSYIEQMLERFEEYGLSDFVEPVLDVLWKISYPILPLVDPSSYNEHLKNGTLKDWRAVLKDDPESKYKPKTEKLPFDE
jgi:hypothetical protein